MRIGHTQELVVARLDGDRAILVDDQGQEAPLLEIDWSPGSPYTAALRAGQRLEAFVHTDARGAPVASTVMPYVELGGCAALKVVDIGTGGAFLDWGLEKHLLLPFAEQRRPAEIGRVESVLVYLDNSGRLAATSRLDHHLTDRPGGLSERQPVELLVFQRTDLGFKAVIDDRAIGLLYKDEVFRRLHPGMRLPGFVRRVRDDGRVDLTLQPPVSELRDELAVRIIERLRTEGGTSTLTDRSPPEAIQAVYEVSKKTYKRALSLLYKERLVRLEPDRVVLLEAELAPPAGGGDEQDEEDGHDSVVWDH